MTSQRADGRPARVCRAVEASPPAPEETVHSMWAWEQCIYVKGGCVFADLYLYIRKGYNNNASSGGKRSSEDGGSNGRHSHIHRDVEKDTQTTNVVGKIYSSYLAL